MTRASDYTEELADSICEQIALGSSLKSICVSDEMPGISTVFRWLELHAAFRDKYARAREAQADAMVEDMLDIADDGTNDWTTREDGSPVVDHDHIARSRLRVDTRKWIASKLKPKKYGERLQAELTGRDGVPLLPANYSELEAARRIAFLLNAGMRAAAAITVLNPSASESGGAEEDTPLLPVTSTSATSR